jgi:hypothetical protein
MIWRGFCEEGGADWERECPGVINRKKIHEGYAKRRKEK